MNRFVMRTSQLLLVVAFVSAVVEFHSVISAALFAAGFVGCIFSGLLQASVDDDRYNAAVLAHRSADDPVDVKIASSGAVLSLVVLVGFGTCTFLSIRMNSPLPAGLGFVAAVAVGLVWYRRMNRHRNDVWIEFATNNSLVFKPGSLWDRFTNLTLQGPYADRHLRLELVWQDSGSSGMGKDHRRSRSEVLIGSASVAAPNVSFCVDNLQMQDSDPEIVQQVLAIPTIAERLSASHAQRVELFEESLRFHMPRVPRSQPELRFYVQLLSDLADEIERHLSGA